MPCKYVTAGVCACPHCVATPYLKNPMLSVSMRLQIREVVYDFYGSRYASCLARLQKMLPVLRLDIFLSSHVEALYEAVRSPALCLSSQLFMRRAVVLDFILHQSKTPHASCRAQVRCKALIQYTTPFVSVNLHTMALAFGTDIGCVPPWTTALHKHYFTRSGVSFCRNFGLKSSICCAIAGQPSFLNSHFIAGCWRMSLPT